MEESKEKAPGLCVCGHTKRHHSALAGCFGKGGCICMEFVPRSCGNCDNAIHVGLSWLFNCKLVSQCRVTGQRLCWTPKKGTMKPSLLIDENVLNQSAKETLAQDMVDSERGDKAEKNNEREK